MEGGKKGEVDNWKVLLPYNWYLYCADVHMPSGQVNANITFINKIKLNYIKLFQLLWMRI